MDKRMQNEKAALHACGPNYPSQERAISTAHGGVRELEGILPISMGIGDIGARVESVSEKIPRASVLLPFSYFFL